MYLPTIPTKTEAARQLLSGPRAAMSASLRMLLISVDGKRDVEQLLVIAKSLSLGALELRRLQAEGFITGDEALLRQPKHAVTPTSAPPPAAATAGGDLRRLMQAKMFALDLAGRMLAGRDAELRSSAREVDSESRFVDWLGDASRQIEAVADAERAQAFRDRVAQAVM